MNVIKIFALLLAVAGLGLIIMDNSSGAEVPLLVGLFMLFVVRPKHYDERSLSLKASAAYVALIIGYAVKLITSNLYSHAMISWQLTDINYFLILVLSIALIIYHVRLYTTSH